MIMKGMTEWICFGILITINFESRPKKTTYDKEFPLSEKYYWNPTEI